MRALKPKRVGVEQYFQFVNMDAIEGAMSSPGD